MNCSQCQELLIEYSLGELDPPEADEVAGHLASGCASCERELVEMEEAMAMIGHSLEPVPVSPRVKQGLLARIRAERDGAGRKELAEREPATIAFPAPRVEQRRSFLSRALPFAAAILVGFTVGALATRYFAGGQNSVANREAQLAAMIEEARKSLGAPEVRVAALHQPEDADAVVGQLMWDARGQSLHVFAFDLEPPAPGRALVVWFEMGDGKLIRAGELEVSDRGTTSDVFDAPEGGGNVSAIVVTEESDESVVSPLGPQRIVARFGEAAEHQPDDDADTE